MSLRKRDMLLLGALFASVVFSLCAVHQVSMRAGRESGSGLERPRRAAGQADVSAVPAAAALPVAQPGAQAGSHAGWFEVNLKLLGTILGNTPLAFIFDPAVSRSGLYRVGDVISQVKIVSIESGKVMLEKDGVWRELLLSAGSQDPVRPGKGIVKDESGALVISKADMMRQMLQAKDLLSKIKILPLPSQNAANRLAGFRIDNVPAGSIIEEAGIRNGDVICSIQGRQLGSLQDAWSMFNRVQDESRVEIVLLRDDKPVTLTYQIEK